MDFVAYRPSLQPRVNYAIHFGMLHDKIKRKYTANQKEVIMSDTATTPPIDIQLPTATLSKGEREYEAFQRLLPELLATCRGKYVAIHAGQVVDSDSDDITLIKRVHQKIGYVPIHVGLVTEQQPVPRIPHYHEYRRQENS